MNLFKCYQTHSVWYKDSDSSSKPVGILWHDTNGGNPFLKRYVQPYETDSNYKEMIDLFGKNEYNNDWNHSNRKAGVNAWIGKLKDGSVATVQAGAWDKQPWGCGGGEKGSCNGYVTRKGVVTWIKEHWIQFEICDDGYKDEAYFKSVYKEACELTAYLCKMFDIDPNGTVVFNGVSVPTILCHADSADIGLGSYHDDVRIWFNKFGYSMAKVRNDVAAILKSEDGVTPTAFHIGDTVKIKKGVSTFYNGKTMASWVPKSTLYVRKIGDNNLITVSTVKEGAVTGTVFASDLILIEAIKETANNGAIIDDKDVPDKNIGQSNTENTDIKENVECPAKDEKKENIEKESEQTKVTDESEITIIKLLKRIVCIISRFFKK